MSSDQHNKPHRTQPGTSAGDVSDAKIITPGSSRPPAAPAPSGGKAAVPSAAGAAASRPPVAAGGGAAPSSAPAGSSSGTVGGAAASASPGSAAASTRAAPTASSASPAGASAPSVAGASAVPAARAAGKSDPDKVEKDRNDREQAVRASSTPPPAPVQPRRSWSWLLLLVLVLLLAALGWWYMQQRFLADERQNALRLQQSEARAAQLEEQIRQLREDQARIQARGNALETRVAESAAQQEQLQALYDDVARVRGDSRLADVERALDLANQHLGLSGNVKGALLALEGAEKRLADSEESKAIGLRRVILQDIERLKSLPEVDLTRSVARLDEVLARIDTLPFLSDPVAPAAEVPEPGLAVTRDGEAAPGAAAADPAGAAEGTTATEPAPADGNALMRFYHGVVDAGSKALDAAHQEFTSLVRIRRIDDPDRLLLAPDQKRTIREGLRLQLLNARISLLNRNEALFRADLARSVETLNRYFDAQQPELKSSIAVLTELQSEPLQLKLPSLTDSMEALAATRAESEKRF